MPLISLDPNFDSELSEIIDRMLNKEPADRFPSLHEIRRRLDGAASRIQSEVSARRRNAISSGAIPLVIASSSSEAARSPVSADEASKVAGIQPRPSSSTNKPPSGQPKLTATDSQLVLREPSNILRTVVVVLAAILACLVIYVMIRTSH